LYITADKVGSPSGGGAVTFHESEAMKGVGDTTVLDRTVIQSARKIESDPWGWDDAISECSISGEDLSKIRIAHFYAGTFTKTVRKLKSCGTKITYTAAAHDVQESKKAHEELGLSYNYPHLTDPELWKRYVGGYLDADVLICPSQHSANVMRNFGATNEIVVIPHGVILPDRTVRPPRNFTVGYLGAIGPDKGIRYLLEAWAKLGYHDGSRLILGGAHTIPGTTSFQWLSSMVSAFLGNQAYTVGYTGWVENVSDFYNSISLYVQSSVSEGFGIEILESMAHNRPVLCSTGAGAVDLVPEWYRFPAKDVNSLAEKIEVLKHKQLEMDDPSWTEIARRFTWDKIRLEYQKVWRNLL
jgi:glycosyltransferase involved in cell wall biosynthesis